MFTPYQFALNSPIYFIDDDGNAVYGTDGEEVTMSVQVDKNGNKTYIFSDNLDRNSDAYKILSAMTITEDGVQGVSDYLSVPTVYSFKIVPGYEAHGETVPTKDSEGNYVMSDANSEYYKAVTIFINAGDKNGEGRFKATIGEGFTVEDYYGLVGSHELYGHNTPEKIKADQAWQAMIDDPNSLFNYALNNVDNGGFIMKIGFWEYENIKRDLGQFQSLLDQRFADGEISEKEYNRRTEIISSKLDQLEELHEQYLDQ